MISLKKNGGYKVMPIRIKVDAYSGHKAEERPRSITIGEKCLKVEEVLDRWYGEDHEYFKLRAEDGYIYIIRYDRKGDTWEFVKTEQA